MSYSDYQKAQKLGEKQYRQAISHGAYPYLPVLEDLLQNETVEGKLPLGRVEIPIALIAGTASAERTTAFASNFMPLLAYETEFGTKWSTLSDDVHENGVTEPITVFEYMQRFYAVEGNKRVSVSKFFGAVSIDANVTRVLPKRSEEPENVIYYEFVAFYRMSGLYEIQMRQVGAFPRLLAAVPSVDAATGEPCPWSDELRHDMKFLYAVFEAHYCAKNGTRISQAVGDAFLIFLEIYGFESLRHLSSLALKERIDRIWGEFSMLAEDNPTSHILNPTARSQKIALTKILTLPGNTPALKIAFLYPKDPQISSWSYNHEIGRRYIEDVFADEIETTAFVCDPADAETVMTQAISDGYQVLFTTSPVYHAVSMRMAVAYPECIVINCSMNTAYRQLRTYYLRIYEAKFLTGVIAGSLTENERVGYIADYPVLGTPASVNAFALGVGLVNPRAKVYLDWSTLQNHDPYAFFREKGIDLISNRDINAPLADDTDFGLYGLYGDISFRLAAPVWNWGRLYEELVHSVLIGAWQNDADDNGAHALNYYWGLSTGAIDIACSSRLPNGTQRLVSILKRFIAQEGWNPFTGSLFTQDGYCIAAPDQTLTPDEIISANWLAGNVVGRIPAVEELNEACHAFVSQHGLTPR